MYDESYFTFSVMPNSLRSQPRVVPNKVPSVAGTCYPFLNLCNWKVPLLQQRSKQLVSLYVHHWSFHIKTAWVTKKQNLRSVCFFGFTGIYFDRAMHRVRLDRISGNLEFAVREYWLNFSLFMRGVCASGFGLSMLCKEDPEVTVLFFVCGFSPSRCFV